MTRLGMEEGEPIEHRLITRAIANAQSKVEAHNFDIRKHLLEYDDVMNKQREIIYAQRRDVLGGETLTEQVLEMTDGVDRRRWSSSTRRRDDAGRGVGLGGARGGACSSSSTCACSCAEDGARGDDAGERSSELLRERRAGAARRARGGLHAAGACASSRSSSCCRPSTSSGRTTCSTWTTSRRASACAATARSNPLQEYQKEGFEMFEEMIERVHDDAVQKVFTVQAVRAGRARAPRAAPPPAAGADDDERRRRARRRGAAKAAAPRRDAPTRSAATTRARAAAARSTRSATAPDGSDSAELASARRDRAYGAQHAEPVCGTDPPWRADEGRGRAAPIRVPGFRFAGVALRPQGERQARRRADRVRRARRSRSGAFTTNRVKAAPVRASARSGCAAGACRRSWSTAATPTPTPGATASGWRAS